MDRACTEPLDVAVLARYACLSRAQFNRAFKRAFGEPRTSTCWLSPEDVEPAEN